MARKLENLLIGLELAFFMMLVSPVHIDNSDVRAITYSIGFLLAPGVFFLLMVRFFHKHEEEVHAGYYVASILLSAIVAPFSLAFWLGSLMLVRTEDFTLFQNRNIPNCTIVVAHESGGAWDSDYTRYKIERSFKIIPGLCWVTPIDTATINKENWIRVQQ